MKKAIEVAFTSEDVEVELDEYAPFVHLKKYYADMEETTITNQQSEFQNDSIFTRAVIKVFADLYLRSNWPSIRYIVVDGIKYDVSSIKPIYPSLRIELGGVYHGDEQREPEQEA